MLPSESRGYITTNNNVITEGNSDGNARLLQNPTEGTVDPGLESEKVAKYKLRLRE